MINNKTYQNVIDVIAEIGNKHQQIATVTTGDIYDVDLEKNTKYPLMHVNPTSVEANESSLSFNFQIFIMDMVSIKNDWTTSTAVNKTNEKEVLSDCLSNSIDIIGILRHSKYQSQAMDDINAPIYFSSVGQSLEPFTERFDNDVTGWVFSITVEAENDFQTCTIPVSA
jgi:hypothetical protein